jgi:hypothetical protein
VRVGTRCSRRPGRPLPRPRSSFSIHVDKPDLSVLDGVYVYEKNPNQPFVRADPTNDPKDFRWILDFEGPDFYPSPLPPLTKHAAMLRPSLHIDNGLFYTFYKTRSTFNKRPTKGGSDVPLNNIVDIIGANIYLATTGSVQLIIDGNVTPLSPGPGESYEIDIFNVCNADLPGCRFDSQGATKEDRNDFYVHYHTFDVPAGEQEYELVAANAMPAGSIAMCGRPPDDLSDPAPCGPGCFGRSSNLP